MTSVLCSGIVSELTFDNNSNVDGGRALGVDCLARIQSTVVTCQFGEIQCRTIDGDARMICGILMRCSLLNCQM